MPYEQRRRSAAVRGAGARAATTVAGEGVGVVPLGFKLEHDDVAFIGARRGGAGVPEVAVGVDQAVRVHVAHTLVHRAKMPAFPAPLRRLPIDDLLPMEAGREAERRDAATEAGAGQEGQQAEAATADGHTPAAGVGAELRH